MTSLLLSLWRGGSKAWRSSLLYAAVVALLCLETAPGQFSGVYYVDNGLDQTVMHTRLDPSEQAVMQEEILHLLGLDQRPHKSTRRLATPQQNSTVPTFMKDIYASLLNEYGDPGEIKNLTFQNLDSLKSSQFRLEAPQLKAINDSDIIMSFVNYGHQEEFETTRRFWFDVQEVRMDDVILGAELRIFKQAATPPASTAPGSAAPAPQEQYRVSVYQLMDGSTSDQDILDSVVVKPDQVGWIVLDVSKALQFWQMMPKLNLGLLLKVESADAAGDAGATAGDDAGATSRVDRSVISPHDLGLIGDREILSPHESFMVAFLQNGREVDLTKRRHRDKRSATADDNSDDNSGSGSGKKPPPPPHAGKSKPRPHVTSSSSSSGGSSRRGFSSSSSSRRRQKEYSFLEDDFSTNPVYGRDFYGGRHRRRDCQKRVLYVSFRDLGWQDWIIAPDGYSAFFCAGECSFPLNTHMNATNHAIVQTLVNLMNPNSAPKPCCAPTQLSEISVLYFDESSNVILKKYKNMVVKSCGCH